MSAFSNYMEAKIAEWLKGTAFGTAPTTVYVGLHVGNPTDTGTGGTPSALVARTAVTLAAASGGATSNSAEVDFGTASGTTETIDYFGIWDAASGGNLLIYGALSPSKTVNNGDAVTIAASALTITLSGTFSTYTKNLVINWLRGTAISTLSAIYQALFNGDPESAGTEVTTTIRAAGRVAITLGTVTDGAVTNSADTDFGTADAGATISYLAVYDAASAGNLLAKSAVSPSKTVTTGDPVLIPAGDNDFTIA